MILACVLLFVFAAVRLFQFQIVEGAEYRKDAQQSTATTVTIMAARGEIVDRNGIPLTQNKAAFNVEFDFTLMEKSARNRLSLDNEKANATIAHLITSFENLGEEWIDNLPVTLTEPYEYLDTATDSDKDRLKEKVGVNDYATAQNCIDWIFRNTGIKKYQENGKCTHCGKNYDDCDYEGYSEEMCRKIAGVRYEMMLKDFSSYNTRFTFAEDVKPSTVAWLGEQSDSFPGLRTVERAIRTYVNGNVASHILGVVGPMYAEDYAVYSKLNTDDPDTSPGYMMSDTVGKSGIEKALESELRGKNGTMTVKLNSKGDVIDEFESVPPVAGKTVQLTLDYNFQKELQQILADYIDNYNKTNTLDKTATAASIVVMDRTGGLLACVSYPYYDTNDYLNNYNAVLNAEGSPLNNRALNGLYRPGSTFKPVVAAGALAEGIIDTASTVTCTGTYLYFAPSYTPGCLQIGHRGTTNQNVVSALNHSCNTFFYDVGRRLGIETMDKYAELFGLGVDTGLEVSNAKGTLTVKGDDWQEGNAIQAAIGQMDTQVTPLQMALEAQTLANHGTRYEAHVVRNLLSNDGSKILEAKEPKVASSFDMSDEAFRAISTGMIQAGQGIGAPNQLTDLGYDVAIKTGTPQTSKTKTNNSFVAFAPVDNPEIAVSVVVEDGYNTNQLLRRILVAYEKSKLGPSAYETPDTPGDGTTSDGTTSDAVTSGGETSEATSSPASSIHSGDTASRTSSTGSAPPESTAPPVSRQEEE